MEDHLFQKERFLIPSLDRKEKIDKRRKFTRGPDFTLPYKDQIRTLIGLEPCFFHKYEIEQEPLYKLICDEKKLSFYLIPPLQDSSQAKTFQTFLDFLESFHESLQSHVYCKRNIITIQKSTNKPVLVFTEVPFIPKNT